jgi:hypothetical protein
MCGAAKRHRTIRTKISVMIHRSTSEFGRQRAFVLILTHQSRGTGPMGQNPYDREALCQVFKICRSETLPTTPGVYLSSTRARISKSNQTLASNMRRVKGKMQITCHPNMVQSTGTLAIRAEYPIRLAKNEKRACDSKNLEANG